MELSSILGQERSFYFSLELGPAFSGGFSNTRTCAIWSCSTPSAVVPAKSKSCREGLGWGLDPFPSPEMGFLLVRG